VAAADTKEAVLSETTVPAAAPAADAQSVTTSVSIKDLLEAGVHFGHQTRRWNPKMKEYIFGERNGIYIIDLQKTHRLLQDALQFVQDLAAQGKTLLFIGTKRQAQEAIVEEAKRCGMPFVTERWLGGLLTNFVTVRRSLERLRELEMTLTGPQESQRERLTKKELAHLDKERGKLEKNLTGIKHMKSVPDAVFVIDTRREAIAVAEARKLKIPVIGVLDTNADPDEVDVPIPGNDDALRAIRLFVGKVADAILAGRGLREAQLAETVAGGAEPPVRRPTRPASAPAPAAPAAPATPTPAPTA
jgi:small subunit ribosomal protein S2